MFGDEVTHAVLEGPSSEGTQARKHLTEKDITKSNLEARLRIKLLN